MRRVLFIIAVATAILCQLFLWPLMDSVHGGTIPGSKTYLPVVHTTCFIGDIYGCEVAEFSLRPTDIVSVTDAVSHTGFDTYINPVTGKKTPAQFATGTYTDIAGTVYYTDFYVLENSTEEAHAFFMEYEQKHQVDAGNLGDEYSTSVITSTGVVTSGVLFRSANTLTSIVVVEHESKASCDFICLAYQVFRRVR